MMRPRRKRREQDAGDDKDRHCFHREHLRDLGGTIAPRPGVSQGVRLRRLFRILYLLSGAAALLYEVVWLRLLTLSMGHTSRAVGILLAAFMGGLAMGAWTAGRSA